MDKFTQDNFTSRRTTGHNMYDPESLMSQAEVDAGMTYENSHRVWKDEKAYLDAVEGRMNTDEILKVAPRVLKPVTLPHTFDELGY